MIKPLTSLRFIFAFLVFLSHYTIGGNPIFSEGYLGVSFFFILSGFILAYSNKDRFLAGTTTKSAFFVARFARIYPLHFITFLAYFALALWVTDPINWGAVLANTTLTQAWIPSQDYYFSFNSPSWSISDEMFFYLMFPLLISFFYRTKSGIKWASVFAVFGLYIVALFLMRETATFAHAFAYINPMFRLLDFIIGIGLYQLWERGANNKKIVYWFSNAWRATAIEVGAIALLVGMIVFSYELPQIIRYSCYYWLPMGLIVCAFSVNGFASIGREGGGGGYVSRLLSLKVAVLLGEISFGFYMIHLLVMNFSAAFLIKLGLTTLPTAIHFTLMLVLVLVGSMVSFYWFETPVNRWIRTRYKQNQDAKKVSI